MTWEGDIKKRREIEDQVLHLGKALRSTGSALHGKRACPHCTGTLPSEARFCPNCGRAA